MILTDIKENELFWKSIDRVIVTLENNRTITIADIIELDIDLNRSNPSEITFCSALLSQDLLAAYYYTQKVTSIQIIGTGKQNHGILLTIPFNGKIENFHQRTNFSYGTNNYEYRIEGLVQ